MKRLLCLLAASILMVQGQTGARRQAIFTITAGTPICVGPSIATGTTVTTKSDGVDRFASQVFIQMLPGGTGVGYVMAEIAFSRVPNAANSGDLTATLAPATGTAPGGSYSDQPNAQSGLINASKLWIDGSHTGDTVVVSYVPK